MIRRLRARFIAVAMISTVIVLTVILGIINVLNYTGIASDADSVLDLLKQSGGTLPELNEDFDWEAAGERYKSPELFFEVRFFSALTDNEGNILSTQRENIFAVSDTDIAQYVIKARASGSTSGFTGDYRFLRYAEDDGERIIFLDCGRILTGQRSVLISCIWISASGLAAVFLLVAFLSGRITKPIAESYEKQRRFITDAGHELKTPITVIDADAALIEMETGKNEWLSDIQLQTSRLAKLIGNLIELSRMEEPGAAQFQRFPLSDIVQEGCESFRAPILAGGHQLDTAITPGIEYTGDEKNIAKLVNILMDNAVKYCGGSGMIRVQLDIIGKNVRLTVENDTDGVDPETPGNMFERFYRGDSSRNSEGYGIGLSIARAITESHRGSISAASTDGHHMTVTVQLPQ